MKPLTTSFNINGIEHPVEYFDADSFDHLDRSKITQVYGVCFVGHEVVIGLHFGEDHLIALVAQIPEQEPGPHVPPLGGVVTVDDVVAVGPGTLELERLVELLRGVETLTIDLLRHLRIGIDRSFAPEVATSHGDRGSEFTDRTDHDDPRRTSIGLRTGAAVVVMRHLVTPLFARLVPEVGLC